MCPLLILFCFFEKLTEFHHQLLGCFKFTAIVEETILPLREWQLCMRNNILGFGN